jgi:predicted small integral membrane protein
MEKAAAPSFLVAVILCTVAAVSAAQQAGKTPRIGFLDSTTASSSTLLVEAFRQELSKLGWIEGKEFHHRVSVCRAKE